MTYKQYKKELKKLKNNFNTVSYDEIRPAMKMIVAFQKAHPICDFIDTLIGKEI